MQLARSLGMSKVIVVVNKMDDSSIRNKGDRFAVHFLFLSLSLSGHFTQQLLTSYYDRRSRK
jgi:hypothetical protein